MAPSIAAGVEPNKFIIRSHNGAIVCLFDRNEDSLRSGRKRGRGRGARMLEKRIPFFSRVLAPLPLPHLRLLRRLK